MVCVIKHIPATEQSNIVIKEFKAQCNRELLQGKATRANTTNSFNIVSTPVNAASSPRNFNDAGPSFVPLGGSFPLDVNDPQIEPFMPDLEGYAERANFNNMEPSTVFSPIPTTRVHSIHPKDQITRDPRSAVQTRGMTKKSSGEHAMISYVQKQRSWVEAMQEELFQFKIQKVWTLVNLPYDKKAISTKWVYRNKKDERGLKQSEEVYVSQPLSFMDLEFPEKVYKTMDFTEGQIDKTLFIKRVKGDILLVQVYVDDIIFGSTKKSLCTDFEQIMHKRFSDAISTPRITFFLGLQVKQKEDGIFISQDKYVGEILKKFGFSSIRTASTPMETNKALTKDEDGEDVDVHLYRSMIGSLMYLTSSRLDIMFSDSFSDSDYTGASLDMKSTTGGCQFLGSRLISWQCKKQIVMANSTSEAEYIDASHCYGQVLWIQNQMLNYGYNFMQTKIHVDNESAICVVKNPIYHSKTKHIVIRHHFIRDSYEKRLIEIIKIHTNNNVADLLTKAFNGSVEMAITTVASLDAVHDSDNIIRTQTMAMPNVDIPQGMDI
ncbi:putative ribonuclease H-like domain-containing protein, partial [Tanacetum coccineum]